MSAPQRYPRDKKKFRDQYLANLHMETANNQLNLNASKMYAATGASAQQASSMTPTEKFAGLEGLKQVAREFMTSSRFLNSYAAADAVNMMSAEEIQFINMYSEFMKTDFKGRNVPPQIFINYVRKLREKLSKTEGLDFGLQQTHGSNVLLPESPIYSQEDYDLIDFEWTNRGIPSQMTEQIKARMRQISDEYGLTFKDIKEAQQGNPIAEAAIQEANDKFTRELPRGQELSQDNPFTALQKLTYFTEQQQEALRDLQELKDGSASQLHSEEGETGAYLPGDFDAVGRFGSSDYGSPNDYSVGAKVNMEEEISEAVMDFNFKSHEEKLEELQRVGVDPTGLFDAEYAQAYRAAISANPDLINPPKAPFASSSSVSAPVLAQSGVTPSTTPNDLVRSGAASATAPIPSGLSDSTYASMLPEVPRPPASSAAEATAPKGSASTASPGTTAPTETTSASSFKKTELLRYKSDVADAIGNDIDEKSIGSRSRLSRNIGIYNDYCEQHGASQELVAEGEFLTDEVAQTGAKRNLKRLDKWFEDINTNVLQANAGGAGRGFRHSGRGVGQPMEQSVRKSAVERSEGYKKPTPYKQFGKYLIHRHKLEDGIVMIKTPSGAKIKALPTHSVSPQLRDVLKVMADGGKPQYHHVQGMGFSEKEKFHHIVKHAQADLEVPSPHKETIDKEMTRFDILRGEIGAGNDNHEMIREFKSMLLKFIREGRIPRREGSEVMEELMMMGH